MKSKTFNPMAFLQSALKGFIPDFIEEALDAALDFISKDRSEPTMTDASTNWRSTGGGGNSAFSSTGAGISGFGSSVNRPFGGLGSSPNQYNVEILEAKKGGRIRAMQAGGMTAPNPYADTTVGAQGDDYNFGFAAGGMMPTEYLAGGKLLDGPGDGMSDSIPAVIRGRGVQRAALADGEFVIPADVVSHLGNGSTKAGAKKLYTMMDQIRKARTGRARQAPAVKADRYLPK